MSYIFKKEIKEESKEGRKEADQVTNHTEMLQKNVCECESVRFLSIFCVLQAFL